MNGIRVIDFVLVNNIYHIGEKQIECGKTETDKDKNVDSIKMRLSNYTNVG